MRARVPLAIVFIVTGLALPLLTRWIVPMLRADARYLDTAASLASDPRSLALFAGLSVIPFIMLAIFTMAHLRRGEKARMRVRVASILVAFAALIILGVWIHMPQTVAGVNFGVMMFPLYGAVLAPVAYCLARLVLR